MFYFPLIVVVVSNVLYHVAQKSVPTTVNPIVSTMVSYTVAMVLCVIAYPFFPAQQPLLSAAKELNWASYVLGVAIVGVEIAYLFVYKTGWNISLASLIAGVVIALLLIPVGLFLFKEQLSLTNILGVVLCLVGLALVTKR